MGLFPPQTAEMHLAYTEEELRLEESLCRLEAELASRLSALSQGNQAQGPGPPGRPRRMQHRTGQGNGSVLIPQAFVPCKSKAGEGLCWPHWCSNHCRIHGRGSHRHLE